MARKFSIVSSSDYLAGENDGSWRHEFVNGSVYAMAGVSANHSVIGLNIAALLLPHVNEPWAVCLSDLILRVKNNDEDRFFYPDVFVSCANPDDAAYFRTSAILIIEVLSPLTERIDRTEKFDAYRKLQALQEYVLVSQQAMEVELFRRRTEWTREVYLRDNTVQLESVDLCLLVLALYRCIKFDDPSLSNS